MKVCYFYFYIYIFCSFAKVQGFFFPSIIISWLLLAVLWLYMWIYWLYKETWHWSACMLDMHGLFVCSLFTLCFVCACKWTSTWKRTSAQHGIHTFLSFPNHFFGIRTKESERSIMPSSSPWKSWSIQLILCWEPTGSSFARERTRTWFLKGILPLGLKQCCC